MGKIVAVLLVVACGWFIWTLTTSIETSTAGRHERTDELSRELDPSQPETQRTTATDRARQKSRSWAKSLSDAVPGTPAGKRNLIAGVGILLGIGILYAGFRKR